MSTPALPWGIVEKEPSDVATAEEEEEEEFSPLSLAEAGGLSIGAKIEVKWLITPKDENGNEGQPFSKWWGATVHAADEERKEGTNELEEAAGSVPAAVGDQPSQETVCGEDAKHEGEHTYLLKYEAGEGFEAESTKISFFSDHYIVDMETGAEMAFRKEGEDWEPPPEEDEDEDEGRGAAENGRAQRTQNLGFLSNDALNLIDGMDPRQQRAVAAGFQEMMEAFREVAERKGPGGEVTSEDVAGVFRNLTSDSAWEKRRRMG